ncbi:DUF2807 domain-containing protein [Mucilaginibacter achroorhodeus]|uniref:DUF2807 domain-containing protein n=1 Tax=Mucilaginibacter achroorhodeus TaxID=2599294 RepID=A0A563U0W9_9SPHI|nr:head GIN domain-containing protein [Mucilaginibacter achroorhodeus]TWR25285.1 DUF2807 domain-containing protein [Mucilaginibacter achroorhodeus]
MKTRYFKISLVIALASLTVLSSSCKRFRCKKGSGNIKTETRKIGEFTKLEISGGFNVTLKQDSSQSLTINADDNLLQYIQTEVSGNTLLIKNKRNICGSHQMNLVVGVRNLEALKASGGIELKSDGRLNTKELELELKGATKINMDLSATNVRVTGKGSTELDLRGQAASADVRLTGSGNINALEFVVGRYNLETTGASDCNINVLNELNVHSTGASEVKYRGTPSTVNTDKTGAASVKKID